MLKIGITGNIGSGKTTVCQLFKNFGVPVFQADTVARSLYYLPEIRNAIIQNFGENIYTGEKLNTAELASIIFNDPDALKTVNQLIHPAVQEQFTKWCNQQHYSPYVLYEAAIIFESGRQGHFDRIIVVKAPIAIRIQRIKLRDGLSVKQIRQRMQHQWTEKAKTGLADFIINNNGKQELLSQVERIHKQLLQESNR